jgi:hypothetical protein
MANAVYTQIGTAISWLVSAGDEAIDLGGTGGDANGVAVGSYVDAGVDPRPSRYMWFLDVDGFDTPPVVGELVNLWVTESEDTTLWSGPESPNATTAGTGAVDRLPNLKYLGAAVVRSTTAGDNLVASGVVEITARYFAPVVHNNTADKLLSTADAHEVRFYPIYDEVQ